MQLTHRFRAAWKAFRGQSSGGSWTPLYNFLGVDKDSPALSEATYFACIKILSEAVGKMPLKLQQHTADNGVRAAREHPLYRILHDRPNPYMSATTFWSAVEANRNHYGNAYVWVRGAGKDMQLWPLPSDQVEVWFDDKRLLADQTDVYYLFRVGGHRYTFRSEEILHFRTSHTFDGVVGVPVREQLRATIDGGAQSQKMLNTMFANGMTAKATLNYVGSLNDKNVRTLLEEIKQYSAADLTDGEVQNIIPLPVGYSLTPLNVKLADSQYLELRQYSSSQIAAAFGIKPVQYNDMTKSSYSAAQQQQLAFYVDTLLYIIKLYEEELAYKLLSDAEISAGYRFKFNVAVLLRADLKTQIETLCQGVAGFVYTPNEARGMLDLPAKPGGDQLIGNGNAIPITMVGEQYTTKKDPA